MLQLHAAYSAAGLSLVAPPAKPEDWDVALNYYEHHIGDFDADTAHLTWVEDMAYTRLIRLYYRREKPIPADVGEACRLVRAIGKDQKQAVQSVLTEFFTLTDSGWTQGRCETEIVAYQKKVEHNRAVGRLGGRPRKTETHKEPENNPLGFFGKPKDNPPQTPDPRPQTNSVPDGTGGKPPMSADEIIFTYGVGMLTSAGASDKQARSFLGGLRKGHGDDVLVNTLRECAKAKPLQPLEWLAAALPPEPRAATKPRSSPLESFAEQDRKTGIKRWEEMTGRIHPENESANVIDITPAQQRISL